MKKIFRKNKKANLLKHSYRSCDFTQNRSDSEHTQSSQTCNARRFRMTTYFTIDSCLSRRRDTSRTNQATHRVRLKPQNDAKSLLSGGRGKQPYERKRITAAGEGRQYTLLAQ